MAGNKQRQNAGHFNAPQELTKGLQAQTAGKLNAAIKIYRHVITQDPNNEHAHNLLGLALAKKEAFPQAVRLLTRACELAPENSGFLGNLAMIQRNMGDHHAAEQSYIKALALDDNNVLALISYARLLHALKRNGEALDLIERAYMLQPKDVDIRLRRADGFARLQQLDAAEQSYLELIEDVPDHLQSYGALVRIYARAGRPIEALNLLDEMERRSAPTPDTASSRVFLENYVGRLTPQEAVRFAKNFGSSLAKSITCETEHKNRPDPDRPLKVGFVSGDFHNHPVARFLEGPVAAFDSKQILVAAYSCGGHEDDMTVRLKPSFWRWREVSKLNDDELAKQIIADKIDILVDLSGHTDHKRLAVFARKPAPIALTWLGYSGTTGLTAIDYIVSDQYVLPDDTQSVETPLRLPDSYLCFSPPQGSILPSKLPALENGYVTFGSLNNLSKISDATVRLWCGVLMAVPTSRLLIKARALSDAKVQDSLRGRFAKANIDPDRLVFVGNVESETEHLETYHRIDVGLDTVPYNGTTTTVEALWMGVPVVGLHGDRFIARVGESILNNVGLGDWVAATEAEFAQLAANKAADLTALADLRSRLRPMLINSPLCDHKKFARSFETALRGVWRNWCVQSVVK